jgi:sec-independent protein translocase protein TatC
MLSHFRRKAIILIVIVAGVITPSSDPVSMLAMAVPMLIFYESSIVIGRVASRHSRAVAGGIQAPAIQP